MAKYVRYRGEFLSRAGVAWRVEILQEVEAPFALVRELTFEGDEALCIEWPETSKEDTLCGSSAVIRIESPGDRTYESLYTIEPGSIRMDVYRNNALYWSGTLDPEFYEEPYEKAAHYVVSLTFSDFGILERMKYDLTGVQKLSDIITHALTKAQINYTAVDAQTYCSTLFTDNTSADVSKICVRSDNFIDEDGEVSTLKEAISGILQPLALRMVQRNGKIYVYDLNGLHGNAQSREITWSSDHQTMGVDKVANNVKVTFSPYSSSELIIGEIDYEGKYDVSHTNLTSNAPSAPAEYGEYYSYYPDYSDETRVGSNWDYNLIDFTIFLGSQGKGLQGIGGGCKYFHLLPMTGSASETSGVAYMLRTGGHGALTTGWPQAKIHGVVPHCGNDMIMRTERAYLPALSSDAAKNYRLRLTEEMLCDCRYNPFSGSTEGNEEDNDNDLKVWSGWVFIPASVTLYDDNGTALYHYKNKTLAEGSTKGHIGCAGGEWVAGADPGGDCYLEYYSTEDLKEDAGIRGWKANRPCIGRPDGKGGRRTLEMYKSFAMMPDGEYIPYPPTAGYIEVKIMAGINGYDYGDSCAFGSTDNHWDNKGLYSKLRWLLYKAPKLDVVNYNLVFDKAELNDIEYSGYLNKAAKDEITIDTICGTDAYPCPTAKGILTRQSTGMQITTLKRAGVTDHPEKLLIGTLYSQFADRKTKLQGEADIDCGALCTYIEQNQGNKIFIMLADRQDCISDVSDVTVVELRPDEYEALEEVN